jgi:hypothetical protein
MIVASNKVDDLSKTPASDGSGRSCGSDLPDYGGGSCRTLHDDWKQARALGVVGLVGGGLLAAASATLFIVSSARSGEDSRLACSPTFTRLALACGARF